LVLRRFVWVIKCLSFFLVPFRSSSTPLYPQSATNQEACPQLFTFSLFHFRLTFESIKELESASLGHDHFNEKLNNTFIQISIYDSKVKMRCPRLWHALIMLPTRWKMVKQKKWCKDYEWIFWGNAHTCGCK
jgi:hypothetical protein